jgi:hypothetical protein
MPKSLGFSAYGESIPAQAFHQPDWLMASKFGRRPVTGTLGFLGGGGTKIVWLAHDEELEHNAALSFSPTCSFTVELSTLSQ